MIPALITARFLADPAGAESEQTGGVGEKELSCALGTQL